MVQPWHLKREDTTLKTLLCLYFPHSLRGNLCVWQRTVTFAKWEFVESGKGRTGCAVVTAAHQKRGSKMLAENNLLLTLGRRAGSFVDLCTTVQEAIYMVDLILLLDQFFLIFLEKRWLAVWKPPTVQMHPVAWAALLYHDIYKSPFALQQTNVEAHASLLQIFLN